MKRPSRATALHEAAHAVVSVRLGLPLNYIAIGMDSGHPPRRTADVPANVRLRSGGTTMLVEGTTAAWRLRLPSADAIDALERFAAQTAAGIVAQRTTPDPAAKGPADHDDIQQIVGIAKVLGIGQSEQDERVREFIAKSTALAEQHLMVDAGTAWQHVATALFSRKRLSAGEVDEIIRKCDARKSAKADD
jgi:hypothetical protein